VLTHRGQTLADIEKFDDPRSDDDEDDEERLGKSFVSDAHFGGGVLKMGDESEETRQNRETLIDNLIAESKKRKEERQKEKEETDDLTDKLDMEFKDVLDVIATIKTPKKSEETPPKLPDSAYDILVRELRFDPRVKPGDKLKSADEIARLEKEKLEKLEADRLKRMKGETETKVIPHRSADDLDDG
jgi:nucleolar protein 14